MGLGLAIFCRLCAANLNFLMSHTTIEVREKSTRFQQEEYQLDDPQVKTFHFALPPRHIYQIRNAVSVQLSRRP